MEYLTWPEMRGNRSADWLSEDYYGSSPVENPQGPESGYDRVLRGGSYFGSEFHARCAYRFYGKADEAYHYNGLRVCVSSSL